MTWTRVIVELDVDGSVDASFEPAADWADAVMSDERVIAASIRFAEKHADECDGEACSGCAELAVEDTP